jgi:hypothetical protein
MEERTQAKVLIPVDAHENDRARICSLSTPRLKNFLLIEATK